MPLPPLTLGGGAETEEVSGEKQLRSDDCEAVPQLPEERSGNSTSLAAAYPPTKR